MTPLRATAPPPRPVGAPDSHAPSGGAGDAAQAVRRFCGETARVAIGCLYAELVLHPKPGLVSPLDNGSHSDMTAATFMRSLFALRRYFSDVCRAGFDNAPFAVLKRLGIGAEARMLAATGGVNTHRGAIFCLGLLCAAIGAARAQGVAPTAACLRALLAIRWGAQLQAHAHAHADAHPAGTGSHGRRAMALHAAGGARAEAASGLPSVFDIGLPALERTLAAGRGMREARIDALFSLMARVSDTNVYHRGGAPGAAMVRAQAQRFIELGGSAHPHWQRHALDCHALFVAHRLSPGGAADLLAATLLVHAVAPHRRIDARERR